MFGLNMDNPTEAALVRGIGTALLIGAATFFSTMQIGGVNPDDALWAAGSAATFALASRYGIEGLIDSRKAKKRG